MEQGKLAVAIGDDTIRFAIVGAHGALSKFEEWPIARFSTLTDALLSYEASSGVPLLGSMCAISIIGATCRDSILLSRGQWAISRAGLRSLFRHDAIIINDVAANAWAILGGQAQKLAPLSAGGVEPDFKRPGAGRSPTSRRASGSRSSTSTRPECRACSNARWGIVASPPRRRMPRSLRRCLGGLPRR